MTTDRKCKICGEAVSPERLAEISRRHFMRRELLHREPREEEVEIESGAHA